MLVSPPFPDAIPSAVESAPDGAVAEFDVLGPCGKELAPEGSGATDDAAAGYADGAEWSIEVDALASVPASNIGFCS